MPWINPSCLQWRKSRHSEQGECVELAELPGAGVAVRDSKNPVGPQLHVSRRQLARLAADIKGGRYRL